MRRPFLAGNWKMHRLHSDAVRLAGDIAERVRGVADRDVAIFPTFVSVAAVADAVSESLVKVGGQDCQPGEEGAFTGAVSAPILRSTGATLVIVGHSERRQVFGDTDAEVARKTRSALAHRLDPIACVGETLDEREAGRVEEVIERQVRTALAALTRDELTRVTVAYEPVWAIGTGKVATPEQAQEVHAFIRGLLRELGGNLSEDLRILYGGSVKPNNVDGLMAMPDIDGALVGGASLDAESFARIVSFEPR